MNKGAFLKRKRALALIAMIAMVAISQPCTVYADEPQPTNSEDINTEDEIIEDEEDKDSGTPNPELPANGNPNDTGNSDDKKSEDKSNDGTPQPAGDPDDTSNPDDKENSDKGDKEGLDDSNNLLNLNGDDSDPEETDLNKILLESKTTTSANQTEHSSFSEADFNERYVGREGTMNHLNCRAYLFIPVMAVGDSFQYNTNTSLEATDSRAYENVMMCVPWVSDFWIDDYVFQKYQRFTYDYDKEGTIDDYIRIDSTPFIYQNGGRLETDYGDVHVEMWIEDGYIYFADGQSTFKADMNTFRWVAYNQYNGEDYGWGDFYCSLSACVDWKRIANDEEQIAGSVLKSVTVKYDGDTYKIDGYNTDVAEYELVEKDEDDTAAWATFRRDKYEYTFTTYKDAVFYDYGNTPTCSCYANVHWYADEITDVGSTPIGEHIIIIKPRVYSSIPNEIDYWDFTTPENLIVTPATLTIETGSAEKFDDSEPLTCDKYTLTGLVNNETLGVTLTGKQEGIGKSDNTYEFIWAENDSTYTAKSLNYTLEKETLGTLEIKEKKKTVDDPKPTPKPDDPKPEDKKTDPKPIPKDEPKNDTPASIETVTKETTTVVEKAVVIEQPTTVETSTTVETPTTEESILGAKNVKDKTIQDVLGARNPQTGDNSNIAFKVIVILFCMGIILAIVLTDRHKENKNK